MCIDNKEFGELLGDVRSIKKDIEGIYSQFQVLNGSVAKQGKEIRQIQDKSLAIKDVCPYRNDIETLKEKELTRSIIVNYNQKKAKKTQYLIYIILSLFSIGNLLIQLIK